MNTKVQNLRRHNPDLTTFQFMQEVEKRGLMSEEEKAALKSMKEKCLAYGITLEDFVNNLDVDNDGNLCMKPSFLERCIKRIKEKFKRYE